MLDADIFQPLVLGLLAISLILSLASFAMLGRLRKTLESHEPRPAPGELREATPEPADTSAWAAPAAAEPRPEPAATEREQPVPAAAEPQPTGGWGEPAPAATPQPRSATATPQGTGWGEPAPAAEPQPTPSAAEEPQEQPFERDGRWWFRRGDELLVYDEQAQQWVPAPRQAAAGGGPQPQPAGAPVATAEPEGGHWKCPTCGAINGTTATSCRMCFTPRA